MSFRFVGLILFALPCAAQTAPQIPHRSSPSFPASNSALAAESKVVAGLSTTWSFPMYSDPSPRRLQNVCGAQRPS
jgi:hypothetical protein